MEEENRPKLSVMALGGGNEVGRSCIILKYMGKSIMFDCGIHPAKVGRDTLPQFDRISMETIDLLLVTHCHLDHIGCLPYVLEKTTFQGECYMTSPTRDLSRYLLNDMIKVGGGEEGIRRKFTGKDITNALSKVKLINYHQEKEVNGIKFTCFNAGHVLGAAMFLVEINGLRILYTGDYSREKDYHLRPAEVPSARIDVLIIESTFGDKNHDERKVREQNFTREVTTVVQRGGKCLLPVLVAGQAQEILLILEKHWEKSPSLQNIPIYYASALMAHCLAIFKTYISMMSEYVKKTFQMEKNLFNFRYIIKLEPGHGAMVNDPCVMMASPGMLQKGLSKQYFEKWCEDPKNGLIITGYCCEGTFADKVRSGMKSHTLENGSEVKINMQVSNFSFAAHADCKQTLDFVGQVKPKYVFLVHGAKYEAEKLLKVLQKNCPNMIFFNNDNGKEEIINIDPKITCHVVGSLSETIKEVKEAAELAYAKEKREEVMPTLGGELFSVEEEKVEPKVEYITVPVDGYLIKKNYEHYLAKERDLKDLIETEKAEFNQKMHIHFVHSIVLVNFLVSSIFPDVQMIDEKGKGFVVVKGIRIWVEKRQCLVWIEWKAKPRDDIIADCIGYLLSSLPNDPDVDLFLEKEDKGVKEEEFSEEKQELIIEALRLNFPDAAIGVDGDLTLRINVDSEEPIFYSLRSNELLSHQESQLGQRVQRIISKIC